MERNSTLIITQFRAQLLKWSSNGVQFQTVNQTATLPKPFLERKWSAALENYLSASRAQLRIVY